MGEGNKKLSKRNPESNLFLHRDRGFIPEGLLNYLALLGWSIAADRDIFSLEELKANFDVSSVNPNPARFDQKKADAINSAHIRMLEDEDFANRVLPYLKSEGLLSDQPTERELAIIRAAAPLLKERMIVLSESVGMLGFLLSEKAELEFEAEALASLDATARDVVMAAHQVLQSVSNFVAEDIQAALNLELVEKMELKPRVAFGPVRVAVSGRRVTPPLFESMEIMGKELTLARLEAFLQAH
jgi:glutamyl-tRNA synthetase